MANHMLHLFTQELAKRLPGNLIIEIHPYKILTLMECTL